MIEVTDEMKQALTNIQHGYQLISCEGGVKLVFSNTFLEKALTRIIELHETNKPTREPLSDYELREMLIDLNKGDGTIYDFARAIEQAHGIECEQ